MTELHTYQFQVQDWKVNAVVGGKGPLILLIHGLGASWQWWQPTITGLCDQFSLCAIDLPGSGSSSPLTAQPSPADYKLLVAQLIELLMLGPALVVGHSLGGYVALQAALQNVPGMKGLGLVAPFGLGAVHNGILKALSFPGIGEALMASDTKLGRYTFLRSLVYDPRSISEDMLRRATEPRAVRWQFLYQLRTGVYFGHTRNALIIKDVPPLPIPIMLFWGKHDSVFPLDIAYRAQAVLRTPPPVIFATSGHIPNVEEPDRFNVALSTFAASLSALPQ